LIKKDKLPNEININGTVFHQGNIAHITYNINNHTTLASVTILPTCDGDVSSLEGQLYVDKSRDIAYSEALHSAVISIGSNHNYFNTEWTPGLAQAPATDDWGDVDNPVCGSRLGMYRLTAAEQQVVGAAYTMALIRLAVNQDTTMLQLLDGSYVKPAVVGRAEIATHAIGGATHRYLYTPVKGHVFVTKGMKQKRCRGYQDSFYEIATCLDDNDDMQSPHWVQTFATSPAVQAVHLEWSKRRGATAWFTVTKEFRNLTGYDTIDFRIANNPFSILGTPIRVI
jgi:hypothetical protein